MRGMNAETLIRIMYVSKNLYKIHSDNIPVRKSTLLLSVMLLYVYSKGELKSLDLYYTVPFSKNSQINILNTLIDLGYIRRHEKKVGRSYIYSVTNVGKEIVLSSIKQELNPKQDKPNKYKRGNVYSLSLS